MKIEMIVTFIYDPTDIADVMEYNSKVSNLIKSGYKESFRYVDRDGKIKIEFTATQGGN